MMEARGLDRAALRVLFLSSLGGALEFYDFVVFGVFGAYVSRAFFPAADPFVSQVQTLAVFAAGYLARPLGGLLFGRRGDRNGRRGSVLLSLAVMSAATAGMGLVPTYAQAGTAASVGFVLLRLVQGFCLGGELPGAVTYAVEVVPFSRVTLACGLVFGCVSAGVLVATGVSQLLHAVLTPAAMAAWGWRIAFLLGGALGGLGVLLRRSLEESPAFLRMRQRLHQDGEPARGPLAELFGQQRGRILLAISATGVVVAFNGLLFAQVGTYLVRTLGYAPPAVSTALNVAVAVLTASLVAMTLVADRVGRLRVYGLGCAVLAAGAVPAYAAMVGHAMPLPVLFALIGLSACCTHGTFAAIMADLFPTRVRFSGVAFSMNISAVAFSGLGPVLVTWLAQRTGWRAAPGSLVLITALVSLGCTFVLPAWSGQIGRDDEAGHAPAGGAAPGEAVFGAGDVVTAPVPKGGEPYPAPRGTRVPPVSDPSL